jgi:amidase
MHTEEQVGTALWRRGASALAAAIRAGEVSSREVVVAHLERIEAVNPGVSALHVVLSEQAMTAADDADRRLARGESIGPLGGVPISVKENVDVAGTATTWGVAAMVDAVSSTDAPAVAHLRAAGAIPLSRGNLPDFALRWHTDNALMGATLNPWDPGRTPGGSSAGEAVALATGMTPLAIGNDLGGSLRWPSQCAGTAALRPTHGRVPSASLIPPTDSPLSIQLFNVQGPMARQVGDLRLALELMSQPSPRDPWYVPAPLVGPAPAGALGVDVAIPEGTSPGIAAGVRRAAQALGSAGYDVREAMPPQLEEAARLWVELLNDDVRQIWPMMEPVASEGAKRFIAHALAATPALDAGERAMRWIARQALARAWSEYQAQRQLILAPVCLRSPFAPDEDISNLESAAAVLESMRMVVPVNLLGLPAVALPAGTGDDGLPVGVQIIGPRFREDLCLDAGAEIEAALGTITPIDPQIR